MSFLKKVKIKQFFTKYTWIVPISLAFIIRIIEITRSSIWHDEGFTMWLIRYNPVEIITRTARDVHPPAYYLFAKLWTDIFGNSVFAIRSLSLVFSIATIFFVYKIVETILDKKSAFWSSMLIAFSPFLLRLTQEARMYSMVAFFITIAVFFFVKYQQTKSSRYLCLFVPFMSIAMYTQYYSFFAIISLWVIMLIFTPGIFKFEWKQLIKKSVGVFDYKWWLANIILIILYLPWFNIAYKQVTRVGTGYWIRPEWITARTVSNSVLQFTTYGHLDELLNISFGILLYWIIVLILIISGLYLLKFKEKRKLILSFFIYGYLPMILVFVYSKLRTPIYQDRYFIFSSLAIFVIWGCLIASIKNIKIKYVSIILIFSILITGCLIERNSENHPMRQITQTINQMKKDNDLVISGSLYTFLDSSYYLGYGNVSYLSDIVGGYGETALFYDQPEVYMLSPSNIRDYVKRMWIIGKTGENYIDKISAKGWQEKIIIKEDSIQAILYIRN